MKLSYKIHTHRYPDDKKRKNIIAIIYHWKNKKSDENSTPQFDYCCKDIESAIDHGFITVELSQNHFIGLKYEERRIDLKEPLVCLHSMDESGYGNDGCPHEEIVLPISNCPFCTAKIITECVEKKRITHTCKKTSRVVQECEDNTTEEITFKKE